MSESVTLNVDGLLRWCWLAVPVLLTLACSDDETDGSGTGGGGAAACTSTEGELQGDIYRSGDPAPRPNALALLRQAPDDVPLQVQADDSGHYTVTLETGDWLVDGQDGDYCETLDSTTVTIEPCGAHTQDIQVECVLGGGGAGGG
jgi:hypothetical protein